MTDSADNTATCQLTLTVNAALALSASGTSLPAATVGDSYTSSILSTYVSASGGTGTGYTYTITSGLPSDFSVNGSNEIASNTTPAAGDAGSHTLTFKVTDSANNTATCQLTLTVNAALALSASGTSLPAATVGDSYTSSILSTYVSASGGTGTGYTYTITSGLPSDFSVNGSNEIASNTTPAAGDAGSHTLTFKVTDSANNTATCSMTLTVNAALALSASGTSLPAATVGDSYTSSILSTYVSASGGSGTATPTRSQAACRATFPSTAATRSPQTPPRPQAMPDRTP